MGGADPPSRCCLQSLRHVLPEARHGPRSFPRHLRHALFAPVASPLRRAAAIGRRLELCPLSSPSPVAPTSSTSSPHRRASCKREASSSCNSPIAAGDWTSGEVRTSGGMWRRWCWAMGDGGRSLGEARWPRVMWVLVAWRETRPRGRGVDAHRRTSVGRMQPNQRGVVSEARASSSLVCAPLHIRRASSCLRFSVLTVLRTPFDVSTTRRWALPR